MSVATIERLVRDDNDRLAWETVGEVNEDRDPYIALSVWFDERAGEIVSAEYVAVCADGRRSRPVRPPAEVCA